MTSSLDSILSPLFPAPFIEGWRRRGIESLLPFQESALRSSGLLSGTNVIVSAPAGSGKTLLAEIALALHLSRRRRVAYLVPTKALAEEKLETFSVWLAPTGLRVVASTRDRPESDPIIRAGRFDLLIAVYEKFHHLALMRHGLIPSLTAIAIDEIQTLADPRRGPLLDLLATRLKLTPGPRQVIALAPPLADPAIIARWLGAELIETADRALELHEGVLTAPSGHFRTLRVPSGIESTAPLFDPPDLIPFLHSLEAISSEPSELSLLAVSALLSRREGGVLLFAPTRALSRRWALALASLEPSLPPSSIALARLRHSEPGLARDELELCLAAGVAFHNADLDPSHRTVIERAFNEGEIRLVVSTPTLALGVNLAAGTVLHTPWRVDRAVPFARAPLDRAAFSAQGGRAARLGVVAGPGRSILVAQSPEDASLLWDSIVCAALEPIHPPLARLPPADLTLQLLAAASHADERGLNRIHASTFSFAVSPMDSISPLQPALAEAVEAGFVHEQANRWRLTRFGAAAAMHGLSSATAAAFRSYLLSSAFDAPADPPLDLFAFLLSTAEGIESSSALIFALRPREDGSEASPELAFHLASLLLEWMDGTQTPELERLSGLTGGAIARLASDIAWLVAALSGCAAALEFTPARVSPLRLISRRLVAGLPAAALPLVGLRVPGLTREAATCLLREGIDSPRAILELGRPRLADLVGLDLAGALESAARRRRPGLVASRATAPATHEPTPNAQSPAAPLIEINLRSPGIVRVGGSDVRLTPLSFDLLAALAQRPGEVVTRAALYSRLWPEGGPEEQQLDGHRRTLLVRLRPHLGSSARAVAEVVRGIGFRMSLPPARVHFHALD